MDNTKYCTHEIDEYVKNSMYSNPSSSSSQVTFCRYNHTDPYCKGKNVVGDGGKIRSFDTFTPRNVAGTHFLLEVESVPGL
jgi:hypothetical protein